MGYNSKFNQKEADHEVVMTNLSHKFVLKITLLICISTLCGIISGGLFFGKLTGVGIVILVSIAVLFSIISGLLTRSALV